MVFCTFKTIISSLKVRFWYFLFFHDIYINICLLHLQWNYNKSCLIFIENFTTPLFFSLILHFLTVVEGEVADLLEEALVVVVVAYCWNLREIKYKSLMNYHPNKPRRMHIEHESQREWTWVSLQFKVFR